MEKALDRHRELSAVVREKLKRIKLDAEFNAFVSDRFPSVVNLFTNTMNRLEKENILLLARSAAEVIQETDIWLKSNEDICQKEHNILQNEDKLRKTHESLSVDDKENLKIQDNLFELEKQRAQMLIDDKNANIDPIDTALQTLRKSLRTWRNIATGTRLASGKYILIKQIGQGGFATIWQGYDREEKKSVAIKILHKQWTEDSSYLERFSRGAHFMSILNHPAIARVLQEVIHENGVSYFVMDYYSGGDLENAVLFKKQDKKTYYLICLILQRLYRSPTKRKFSIEILSHQIYYLMMPAICSSQILI